MKRRYNPTALANHNSKVEFIFMEERWAADWREQVFWTFKTMQKCKHPEVHRELYIDAKLEYRCALWQVQKNRRVRPLPG